MQDRCINLQLAAAFYALKHSRHISTRAMRDQIMFVYIVTHKTFLLRLLSTARYQTSRDLPQNETSDTQYCDRQCRDDFGIHTKPNTNEEEVGRTRFRLIETSGRRVKIIMAIVTSFASVSYSCKSWRVPIRGAINAKPNSPPDQIVPADGRNQICPS